MDAARSANIHTFVTSLPGGYETKVSVNYEIKNQTKYTFIFIL